MIRQLCRDHEIALLSFAGGPVSEAQLAAMRCYCQSVQVAPFVEFEPKRLRALLGFFSRWPRSVADTYSQRMEAMVRRVAAARPFDLVVASELRTAPYALLVRQTPRVLEDVELTPVWEQFARQQNPMLRLRYGLTWYKTSRFVVRLLRQFDACTVVSEQERSHVMRIAPDFSSVAVAPNGVDLAAYAGDFGAPEPNTLIHIGALSYSANWDAMSFFLNDIFPLLKRRRADVTVRITGKTDGAVLDGLPQHDGVIFTGYLPDIRPAVARSWVSIVPLRVGGGTRVKILEAMALGTAVVSTSKGAEGLDVTHGENILIANTAEGFVGAVLSLLDDSGLRARLVANARRLVETRYRWEDIGRELHRVMCHVLEERAAQ